MYTLISANYEKLQVIREHDRKVLKELSSQEMLKTGKDRKSVAIENLYFNNWVTVERAYIAAALIDALFPQNQINWTNTFLPIEHWLLAIGCFIDQNPEHQWYRMDDKDMVEEVVIDKVQDNLSQFNLIKNNERRQYE